MKSRMINRSLGDEERADGVRKFRSDSKEFREAKEVFLFMNKNVRISRDLRARWFFEHLDRLIRLDFDANEQQLPTSREIDASDTFGVAVMGLVPKTGPPLKQNEKLRITATTHITYFSKFYCLIFILDFSPSCFVSDESGCVLYTKLVESVAKCVKNVTKKFKFAGSHNVFMPRIYATFCAFTPFLCFPENSVLLQSVLLDESNVNSVVEFLYKRIKVFIDKLCIFAQPHMKEWNRKRRKFRKANEDDITNLFQECSINFDDILESKQRHESANVFSSDLLDVDTHKNSMSDQGFIQPDWALIFMLRMGLMGVQMCLADNIQSNIIIVTDGVCGIPDTQALQHVLSQMRSFSILCSFIQLHQSLRGPTLGHVGFPELFHFLSTASFGSFLTENQLDEESPPSGYSIFHRSFLAWSFQRALVRNSSLPDLIPKGLRTTHVRNRRMSRVYDTTLCRLLYVRLREGYTIKHVDIQRRSEDSETIVVKLCLVWKPQIFIEYIINAPWKGNPQRKCKIHVDVFVDAIANSTIEMLSDFQESDSIKSVILSLNDADCLMLHLHLFNCDFHYYHLPKEFDEHVPFFEYRKNFQRPILNQRYENLKNSKFISFWQPLCVLDERIWQKWAHTHTIRIILNHDLPLPDKIFTPSRNKGRFAGIFSEEAFQALHRALKESSSFTLVKEQSYVSIIYENDGQDRVPKYFYIIKTSIDMPFVILKVAFLGGVSGPIRKKIVDDLKSALQRLKISRENLYANSADATSSPPNHSSKFCQSFAEISKADVLFIIRKPLERILIKYRRLPRILHQLVRLERSEKLRENREMILHNAIAKYLSCRRQIWHLRGVFLKNVALSNNCLEFIMQTLMRRRLNQGFHITYGKNGVVNLVRQRNIDETVSGNVRIEQCVLFGPTLVEEPFLNKNAIKKSRKHSLNVEEERAEKFTTLDSNESVLAAPWTQIVTEIWTEPRDHVKTFSQHETADELLEENGIIIRVLFTFEQWQNACTSRIWVEKPMFYADGKSNENVDEVVAHQNTSPAVDCIFNAFSLKELLEQANEKEVMFLPSLGFSGGDPHSATRLSMLLNKLHRDLSESYDACVEVSDECIPQCIVEAMSNHFASEEFCNAEANVPGKSNSPTAKMTYSRELTSMAEQKGSNKTATTALLSSPPSPTTSNNFTSNLPVQMQLSSPCVRRSSVSPPPSSNSSSSFPFETPTACSPNLSGSRQNVTHTSISNRSRFVYKDVEQEMDSKPLQFYPENFDHSSYLETLCEHRSTSVPLLLTADKNVGLTNDANSSSFLPPSIAFSSGICAHSSNQSSAFDPVLRKSVTRSSGHNWELPVGKLRPTTTTPFLAPTKSVSNVITSENPTQPDGCDAPSQESFVSAKKKHSASAFSNDELSSNTRVSIQVPPTKKYSAPPTSSKCRHRQKKGQGMDCRDIEGFAANDLCEADEKQNYSCSFKLFAKRLNTYRLVFFMVPKDVKTIQMFAPMSLRHNMFPVFVFHCDKARIAQNLSMTDWDHTKWGNPNDVLVENFCRKAETSTLAHLQQQISRRSKREERKANNVSSPLQLFFANVAALADGNAELISDQEEPIHATFDLANYCELVFEEYIYTKCYIATVYSCLGQEIFVPPFVLHEVMDYRCEHIRVEIGSINEILSDTCIHMKRGRNFQRVGRRASGASKYQRRKSQKLFSSSSSSSTSTSSSPLSDDGNHINFGDLLSARLTLSASDFESNKRMGVLFKENGECQWESDNDSEKYLDSDGSADICEDELSDFRQSFDDLLKQHSFIKVPGLTDYFFYWPQPINGLNSYKINPYKIAEDFGNLILAPGFDNSQNKQFPPNNFVRDASRRTSASISSLSKRRYGAKNSDQNEYMESVTFAHQGSNESSDVGEYFEGTDEIAESDKSSLPEEFIGTNNWPLFIQFSASVYVNGQVYSFSIEFIPNCLKDIFKKCSSLLQGNQLVDLSNIEVNIDMYVFTWPLPSQCPYQESGQFLDGNANNSYNVGGGGGNVNADSYDSSMVSADFLGQPPPKSFRFTQALNQHSIIHEDNFDDENDDIFEQPVEIFRQIPVHEHRVLRKIQRNIQRMLKMEYILIMSREFDRKPKLVTLRRVIRFISEEIGHTNKLSGTMEAGDGRFEMMCKELVLVSEPQLGLRSLYDRFTNLKVDYCTLKRFPPGNSDAKAAKSSDSSHRRTYGKHVSKFLNDNIGIGREHDVLFYSCGVDSADGIAFTHTRHELIKKPRRPQNTNVRVPEANEFIPIRDEEFVKEKMMSGSSIITFPQTQRLAEQISETGSQCTSNSTTTISALNHQVALNTSISHAVADDDNDEVLTAISVDEDEVLSDITMPLNDSSGHHPALSITARINDALMTKSKVRHHSRSHHGGKHLIHDFWLILQVNQKEDGSSYIKIYFCQRSPLIHTQLFSKACQVVEEQIKIVNQELLLEKMHRTEECDQLLVDVDSVHNLPDYHHQSQYSREAVDEPYFDTSSLSKHASKFVHQPGRASARAKSGAMLSSSISHSDEEELDAEGEIGDLVRYKYGPGHFACDMMWHCWFPIHPRLKSTNSDNGFMALRLGLEGLAVRNRSNMYVYRERTLNVVYMRLHSSEESVFSNIALKSDSWREEVLANINNCILLSVHGVRPPGEEITEELKSVLQRRLNIKTLEEIQKALLKNAHIRLEWCDIKFIQTDAQHPTSICYFTIPSVAQHHLVAIKHYLTQQLQTFCILPKFREQSGMYGGQHSSHHLPSLKSHSSSGDFSTTSTMISSCDALSATEFTTNCQSSSSGYRTAAELKRSHTSGLGTPPPLGTAPPLAFVPYVMPNMPPNPINYVPTFFLFNKPAGVGTRDTGVACLEMKLVDWHGAVIENFQEAGFCPSSRSLLYPGVPNADRLHRAARFHDLSKCVQIAQLSDGNPIPGTCALFQFNIWKNGNVEVDELQARLKMCAQQAISDLITEFGLLSAPIFESNANYRSTAGSFSFPAPQSSSTSITPSSFGVGGTTPTAADSEKGYESMAARISQLQRQNAQDLESKRASSTTAEVMPSYISIEYSGKPPLDIGQPVTTPTKLLTHSIAQVGGVQSEPNLTQQHHQRQFTTETSTDSLFSRKSQQSYQHSGEIVAEPVAISDKLQLKIQATQPTSYHPHPLISPSTIGISQTIGDQQTSTMIAVVDGNTVDSTPNAFIQQRQLPSQDPPLSTLADQSSHNFYHYFHSVTNPKLSPTNPMPSLQQQPPLMPSSAALVYATSTVSPFALPSQVSLTSGLSTATNSTAQPGGSSQYSGLPSSEAIPARPMILNMQHHSNSSSGGASSSAVPGSFDGVDPRLQQQQHQNSQRVGLGNQLTPVANEFLRIDFVAAAAEWFDHVNSKTKGFPEMSHSVRKFNFLLDCDGSARKIIQVIYERLKLLLRSEKIVLCRSSMDTAHSSRHLQTLLSVTSLLEPFDKDFGRVVFIDDDYTTDLVLVAFPEQQCLDTLRYGNNISSAIPTCLHKLADGAQSSFSKFLPSLRPFVPRQRILYLILRGENITLFLYNYTNEVVLRVKEIVERAILWHNARSRLLREIGLHKMGITHLSTLKSLDSKFNSYLLLTWMNPEILVRNDYPIESLTTPDFAKLPRPYSQFLLKLYRFSDPAFVAKNLNVFPFEDQTQQMLTLREDVRSMLNEHRIFQEIHKQLLSQQSKLSEDFFSRIIGRSRQVHYVQSPLLLFPSWRRIIASVRTGAEAHTKHSLPSLARFSTATSAARECLKERSKTVNMGHYDSRSHSGKPLVRMLSHDEEPCLLKIQHMLIDDYVAYLKIMGLNIINFAQTNKRNENSLSRSVHYESTTTSAASSTLSSGGSVGNRAQYQFGSHHQNFVADDIQPPNVWMYLALEGGILFVQLCFVEPYFYVRILQWNNSHLVVIPNSTVFKTEVENLKKLERKKNELVQKCHVHSFTYDFHLRIVSRYLIGGKHVLFNSGYNTNGFLVDFLQYYECRPPNARNCLYEETVKYNKLQVGQANVWEYFLDNKSQFGWNVVRLKLLDSKTTDEFMLVSNEEKQLLKHPYKFVRIVLNNNYHRSAGGVIQASGSGNSSSAGSNSKFHEMALKFYVLLVTEEKTYPITDELKRDFIDVDGGCKSDKLSRRHHHPSGEFTRIARNPAAIPSFSTSPTTHFAENDEKSKLKLVNDDSISAFRSVQPYQRHYQNHRSAVGAKFSYCCDLAGANEEELAVDAGLYQKEPHSMSLAERRSVAGRLKIASSTSEIVDDDQNFLFSVEDDTNNRKRFSSGGNLLPANRRQQNLSPKANIQKLSLGSIRRNSDAPSLLPTSIGGALPNLTKFFTSNTTPPLDADSSSSMTMAPIASLSDESDKFKNMSPTSFSPLQHNVHAQQQQISFQKVPPRRHYRFYQDISRKISCPLIRIDNSQGKAKLHVPFHERGAVVPPEQVIYLHYLSSVQRKLQSFLEMAVEEKRDELLKFILEADKLCYVDMLWKSLLSSKSTHIRRQPATLFSTATTSKSDLATSSESSTLALQKSIKLSGSVEMDPSDFSALLNVVRMEPMAVEEPRLNRILADMNFANLCRFLLHYYEGEHRCRYFVQNHKTYLIITNPSFLDSAAMFRNDSKTTEIFFLFKNIGVSKIENEPFSTNAIHKLFEDVMSCLSAFMWSELLHNPPILS